MTVSVITPAAKADLTTVEALRAELGLTEAVLPEASAKRFIKTASARAASYCRRGFGVETVIETLSAAAVCGFDEGLLLGRWPIVGVDSVTIDGVAVVTDGFAFDDRRLYLARGGVRTLWVGRNVVVQYRAGWHLPSEGDAVPDGVQPLPADIESAVIKLAGVSCYGLGRDPGIRSESTDGVGSNTYYVPGQNAALPSPEAEATLRHYRVLAIG